MTESDRTRDGTPLPDGGAAEAGTGPGLPAESETASFVVDASGHVRTWSDGAASLTEWAAGDVREEPVAGLFAGSSDADWEAVLAEAATAGHAETAVRCRRSTGSTFPASVTLTPRQWDGDTPTAYTAVLRDETPRRRIADERQLLAAVGRAVARADSFVAGVETALEAVCDHTQWAYGEAWTPTEDGESLSFVAGHAADPSLAAFVADSEGETFAAGEGLPGRVYASGMPEWIPDAADERGSIFHRSEQAAEAGLRAALCVPVTTGDRVVAVLAFFLRERRDADDRLVEVVTDVAADLGGLMARKKAADALERERALLDRVFETSPVGLLVTGADSTVERANREAGAIVGQSPEWLVGRQFGTLGAFRDADGDPVADADLPVARAVETGEAVADVDLRLERADGETRWVRVSAAPIPLAGDGEHVTVALEDVTERTEREQSLRTFRAAVEQAGHSIYVTDPDGTIQYVNPAFEEMTGYSAEEAIGETPNILNSGEHGREFFADLWRTILDGEVWTGEVTNERKSGEQYVINQTIAPILEDGEIQRFVAVNDEITEQKRRERTLRRQRNSLERVRQIIESLRPINRELARAGTREKIDRVVCEELARSEAYLFAWVGGYNRATGEIEPREWAGVADGFVDELDLAVGTSAVDPDPFERAVAEAEVSVRQEIPTAPVSGPRRDRAIKYGYQSVAAVPVTYGETVLGVLGVYSARPEAFDRYERGLLRELGERVGHAINAAENKQLLQADTLVEVEFELGADSVFAAVSGERGCRLSVRNVVPTADLGQLCHVEVEGAAPAAVVETFDGQRGVDHARVVRARGATGVVEVTVRSGPLSTLLAHGGTVRSLEAADGDATLLAETAPGADVGALVSDLEATHEGTVFVAKRTLTRDAAKVTTTKTAIEESLTDRQREVLTLAYHAGFFESPRDSTGEELAEALGIAAPTFYQHVRTAVRKVLSLLVDAEDLRTNPERDESVARPR